MNTEWLESEPFTKIGRCEECQERKRVKPYRVAHNYDMHPGPGGTPTPWPLLCKPCFVARNEAESQ